MNFTGRKERFIGGRRGYSKWREVRGVERSKSGRASVDDVMQQFILHRRP